MLMISQEAIGQKGVDYNVTSYSLSKDYTADTSLGNLAGNSRDFTIYGNTNDIVASSSNIGGITVTQGQALTIDKVGDVSNPDSKGFSKFTAEFGGAINNEGTLTVTDSIFSGNKAGFNGGAIYKTGGTLTVTGSTFSENSASLGGAIYNKEDTLSVHNSVFSENTAKDNGGAIYNEGKVFVYDSTFSGNSASLGGAIDIFSGEVNLIAENKDVLFENNNAILGGAIFSRSVLNLNAKNGNKIKFAAATDTANNDIVNLSILNLNEGNIEILSAITDAVTQRGTTNIGTKDTTATVVANAITQKALNINNGSSLAIDADGLKINYLG